MTEQNIQRALGNVEARLGNLEKHDEKVDVKLDKVIELLTNERIEGPKTCIEHRAECQKVMGSKISLNTSFRKSIKWAAATIGTLSGIAGVIFTYYKFFA